jgi:uncharacterized membrane protein
MILHDAEAGLDVRPGLRWSAWILAGMCAASAAAWIALPGDPQLAVHWGIDGRPDRFASKGMALLLLPGTVIFTTLVFAVAPFLDPRRANLASSRPFYERVWIGSMLLLALTHALLIAAAFGLALPIVRVVTAATGLFIAAFGDVLAKSRSNFVAGIRTPWTLSSDTSWEKTHRWTGRLFVATGLGAALASLLLPPPAGLLLLMVGLLGSCLAGFVISYVFWRRDPERKPQGASQDEGPP